ncbi:MAG: type II secretion system protein, partial [Methylococcaceae bacterium]|nr:type II secretion system protein [Methylococcaceae bacterium]
MGKQAGISLIELIVFILVVAIAVTAILSVMSSTVAHSADSLERKQAIAIAEGLLEEILAQPFTWCDPDDANLTTATSASGCASLAESVGRESGESRFGPAYFDNVNDYHGYADAIRAPDGSAVANLADYAVSVAVSQVGGSYGLSADAALQVDVSVSRGGSAVLTLSGYRFRHS